jgi:hypothetical protein
MTEPQSFVAGFSYEEPWTQLPWAVAVAALPDGAMRIGDIDVKAISSGNGQAGVIHEIERERSEAKAAKVFLSKCFYRLLPQTYGAVTGRQFLEQHYCYAAFV